MKGKFLFVFLGISLIFQISANAGFFDPPKPADTSLVSTSKRDISGGQFTFYEYRSKLSPNQILDFYETKLKSQGWSRLQVSDFPMAKQAGFSTHTFIKDDRMMVINISPFKTEDFIFYTISEGMFPSLAGGKQPLDIFKEPQKLDFMPIYPGAKQVEYNKTPSGIQVGYMATGGIEAVKGFYLQNLPKYGWSNVEQEDIDKEEFDLSAISENCPACAQLPEEIANIAAGLEAAGANLKFVQGKKTLMMNIFSMGQIPGLGGLGSGGGLGDTMITVIYYEE